MKDNSEADQKFLDRAKQLAKLGSRLTSPNPKVGAVIVSNGKIIGEGYHHQAGQAHAEVNALQSVTPDNQALIPESTIYVSLEPCSHFGRTPPCSLAIINAGIKRVVMDSFDPSDKVNGKGVELMRAEKVNVIIFSPKLSEQLPHRAFKILTQKKRPAIILKFAQSNDGFLGQKDKTIWLTNQWSKRLVHRWRAAIGAIIVGTNTFRIDDPLLTTRYGFGEDPLRIIPDFQQRINADLKVFTVASPIWILVHKMPLTPIILSHVTYKIIPSDGDVLAELNTLLVAAEISYLFVEGGRQFLQAYLDQGLWDEAIVFQAEQRLDSGIKAPTMHPDWLSADYDLLGDKVKVYHKEL